MNTKFMEYTWGSRISATDLDVCVVAINRPSLLENTLHSFSKKILYQWPKRRLVMNVDPVPDLVNKNDFIQIGMKYFENGIMRFTDFGDFSNAVKWTWANSTSKIIFNLEDDWLCFSAVKRKDIETLWRIDNIVQIRLPKRHQFQLVTNLTSGFSLNPSFIDGEWARQVACQLKSKLDPEKQIRHGLTDAALDMKNCTAFGVYISMSRLPVIYDSGLSWKRLYGMEKRMKANLEVSWSFIDGCDKNNAKIQRYLVKLIWLFHPLHRLVLGSGQLVMDIYRKFTRCK